MGWAALLIVFAQASGTAPDCVAARSAVADAERAAASCAELGASDCRREQATVESAHKVLEQCLTGDTATPRMVNTFQGTVAVVIEAASPEDEAALDAGIRLALRGVRTIDAGQVRAAKAFLPPSADDAALDRLRTAVGGDELLLVSERADGARRFLSVLVVGRTGVHRYVEADSATLGQSVRAVISDLYPVASEPEPTPTPFAWEEPTPAPTPFAWAEPTPTPEPPAPKPPLDIRVGGFGGSKSLASGDWAPLARHDEIGLVSSIGRSTWPVHAAVDISHSWSDGSADGIRVKSTTREIVLGARKFFPIGRLEPEAGLACVVIQTRKEAAFPGDTQRLSGTGLGFAILGGVRVRVTRSVDLGVQIRYSSARTTLGSHSVDTGGLHTGVVAGARFGR